VTLPTKLLQAIAHDGGGHVVLVVGAGTSVEPPTNLPSSSECAEEVHRRLLADGVLTSGACQHPQDLSAVADAVFAVTGHQADVVLRLPRERFVTAKPNQGHRFSAALLRERAISSVLTLNFDLAFSNALTTVGAAEDVAQVRGPEDQAQLGAHNLVYLHRTANHDPELWILRSEALVHEWTDSWEEAIANRVLTSPVVVFAGLGSPAAVLTETTKRLRRILKEGVKVFQVDPIEREESSFADQLQIKSGDYIRLGWVEFMNRLAERVTIEQLDKLQKACYELCNAHRWPHEDVHRLLDSLATGGLLLLGAVRARWMLEEGPYLTQYECDVDHIADVTLAVRVIERESGTSARIDEDGAVEFWEGTFLRTVIAFVSARGKWRWGAIEPRVERARQSWRTRQVDVRKVVVVGATGAREAISPPETIVGSSAAGDIIRGASAIQYFAIDDLRRDEARVSELMSA